MYMGQFPLWSDESILQMSTRLCYCNAFAMIYSEVKSWYNCVRVEHTTHKQHQFIQDVLQAMSMMDDYGLRKVKL